MDNEKLGAPDAEEQAALIAEESRGLSWCLKHELVVWFDGRECPACAMLRENREEAAKVFLEMTKEMEED